MGLETCSILELAAVVPALGAAAAAAARDFVASEETMRGVAFESGKLRSELGDLKDQFIDLSAKTGQSIQSLAHGYREFVSQYGNGRRRRCQRERAESTSSLTPRSKNG